MRKELDLIEKILASPDEFTWETPMRNLIPTDYECAVLGDASLNGGGAFSDKFRFWCYIEWPAEIVERALKGKRRHNELVSINCLEYVIILISHNAVLDAIELSGFANNVPHPKSKIMSDNKTADT